MNDRAVTFERVVLGTVFLNPESWHLVSMLRPDDLLLDSHRRIYARMTELAESCRPIDTVTLVEELDRHKELQVVGDVGYISSLTAGLPDRPLESIRHYVDEVRKNAALRRIVHAAESIQEHANDPAAQIADLRDRLLEAEHEAARYDVKSRLRISSLADIPDPFSYSSDEIAWVVHGLIPARGVTIVAGEAGAGKTWLALLLARAIIWGGDFLGRGTRNTQVVYLDRENPLSLIRDRLQVLFGGRSEFRPWGLWCADEPPMIGDPRLVEFARNEPVLVIDSMIRFHEADENSATQMAPVMASLRELANAGASVVVLHHKSKSETSSYRGSSDIVAGADAAFALAKRDGLLELRTIKNRFAAETTVEIQPDFAAGTFSVSSATAHQFMPEVARLADVIGASPGLTQNEVIKRVGMNRRHAIELLRRNEGTLWQSQKGGNRSKCYFRIQTVPSMSTRNRLAGGSDSGSTTGSYCLESPATTQVVPGFPPFRGGNHEQLEYHGA